MNESEKHVAEQIRLWVWSGFYAPEQVQEFIDDVIDEDCDVELLRSLVEPEFDRKTATQTTWPAVTDCDRLDLVFYHLHEKGICALANAGYTMSDGYSDVAEVVAQAPKGHYHGYCFYHGQDVDRAVDGQSLMLAFGDLSDDEAASIKVGRQVADALKKAGFETAWDGTFKTRIDLPGFNWKRRLKK